MFSPSRYVESGSLSVALFPEETAGGVAGSVTSTVNTTTAHQTMSGSIVQWEGSWLGFNHWSKTRM